MDGELLTIRARIAVQARRLAPSNTPTAVGVSGAVAVLTCLLGLGSQPLSWDEAVTANAAHRSFPQLWTLLRHTDAPLGAYYVLMHGWIRLVAAVGFAPSEVWLRLPSAVASIITVGLVAAIVSSTYGPVGGALSGVLLASHPLFVFYAHDARPYAIVVMLSAAATLVLMRKLDTPSARWLLAYGTLMVAALYTHIICATFVLVLHVGFLLRTRRRHRQYVAVALAALVVTMPLILRSRGQRSEVGWVAPITPTAVGSFVVRVAGGGVMAPVIAVTVATVAWRIWRTRRPVLVGGIALATVGPVGALVAVSVWHPLLVPRYVLVVVPVLAILVAVLVIDGGLPATAAGALGAAVLAASLGSTVVQDAQPFKYEDFRAAAGTIAGSAQPGDGLVFLDTAYRVGLLPYSQRGGGQPTWPVDVALVAGSSVYTSPSIGGAEVPALADPSRIDRRSRIFTVASIGTAPPAGTPPAAGRSGGRMTATQAKEAALQGGYTVMWTRHFGDVVVSLFQRRTGGVDTLPGAVTGRQPEKSMGAHYTV
jgi:mannosyltransferase